jgi:hypothetical protein
MQFFAEGVHNMYKGFAVTAVLVLLLSAAGHAQLLNMQSFGMDPFNSAFTLGGDGGAGSTNSMVMEESQLATDQTSHVTQYQGEAAAVVQGAGAVGSVGLLGVTQGVFPSQGPPIGGVQTQWHLGGSAGPWDQNQDLWAALDQDVISDDGIGSALGIQNLVGIQTQLTFTLWGGSANVQGLGLSLFDGLINVGGGGTLIHGDAAVVAGQN